MAARFEAGVLVSLTDKLTRPMQQMVEGFKKFGDTLKQSRTRVQEMQAQMKAAGATASKIGSSMTRKMTLPILGLGVAAVKTSVDFNKGMANVATLIPGNQKRVQQLGDAMLKMSVDTGTSTSDLTAGLYQVISAFGDGADSVDRMALVNKAAAAGLSTTTDAVNLLAAVTKGYGDTSAAAMKQASDLSFTTVRLGQTTFPELASSMGRVIPLAAALGVSQKELFATFSSLTGVTGTAAEVSTQMRGAIQSLMAPTADMKKAMQGAGFASGQAMIKQLGLVGALERMMKTTGGNTEQMKKLFPTIESMPAILQLTGKGAQKFKDDLKAMGDAAGATDQAFKDQSEGVNKAGFTWKKMTATLKVMAIQIGQTLLPVVAQLASMFSGLFSIIGNLPGPIKAILIGFLGLLAAVGPVLKLYAAWKKLQAGLAFLQTTKIAGPFLKAMGPLSAVFAKLMIIAAVVAIVASAFKKNTINIQAQIDATKQLTADIAGMADKYDSAAKAVNKLTAEEKARMELKMIELNQSASKQIQDNLMGLLQLKRQMNDADKDSLDYRKAHAQFQLLEFQQTRLLAGYKQSQKYLGRSDIETQRFIGQYSTVAQQAKVNKGDASGISASLKATLSPDQRLLQQIRSVPLNGNIQIHITSDGAAAGTATFPGAKVGAKVSAQSVKNGRTR